MKIFLTILYVIACIGLIVSVLFQDESAGSMAGGAGGGFGKKKGLEDKLSMLTKIFATSFLVLAILMILFAM